MPFAIALLLIRGGGTPFPSAIVTTLQAAGVMLTVFGELIRLWAVRHIGAVSRTRSDRLGPLVATGPFALTRNPLYIGNILLWCGFALIARLSWMAPVTALLLGAEYSAIVGWEEHLLASRYGDRYREYAAHVPRWIPSLVPGFGRGAAHPGATRHSWKHTLFSERGTLIAIAAGYLLLWVKLRF